MENRIRTFSLVMVALTLFAHSALAAPCTKEELATLMSEEQMLDAELMMIETLALPQVKAALDRNLFQNVADFWIPSRYQKQEQLRSNFYFYTFRELTLSLKLLTLQSKKLTCSNEKLLRNMDEIDRLLQDSLELHSNN